MHEIPVEKVACVSSLLQLICFLVAQKASLSVPCEIECSQFSKSKDRIQIASSII
jgi:hypothetical protein